MASERADVMSDDLREWVERRAEETDRSPEAVLARSVAAYRFLEGEADALGAAPGDVGGDSGAGSGAFEASTDDLRRRMDALERRVGEVAGGEAPGGGAGGAPDLRERLDAVASAVERKAAVDHDHADLRERLSTAVETAEAARERADAIDDRVAEGFENYEEILEYLTDTADDLDAKLTRLARAVVSLRRDAIELEAAAAERAAADEIREVANRHGESRARCGDCSGSVDVGLLSSPHCPHCDATFDGFEPGSGIFSSPELTVGTRPALEGDVTSAADPADLLEPDDAADGAAADGDGPPGVATDGDGR
jgi:hypothetical protein